MVVIIPFSAIYTSAPPLEILPSIALYPSNGKNTFFCYSPISYGINKVVIYLDKAGCKKCAKALQELENIDDEADQLGIGFVKIHDSSLAEEYNLGDLPKLVYYRHQIPIVYERQWFVKKTCLYINYIRIFEYVF